MLPSLFSKLNTPRSFHLPPLIQFLVLPPFLPLSWGITPKLMFQVLLLWPTLSLPLVCSISPHFAGTLHPWLPTYTQFLHSAVHLCTLFLQNAFHTLDAWATQAHGLKQGSNTPLLWRLLGSSLPAPGRTKLLCPLHCWATWYRVPAQNRWPAHIWIIQKYLIKGFF